MLLCVPCTTAAAQDAIETDGVVYRTVNGRDLLLDIETPKPDGTPKPAVVFLCGNGWGYYNIDRGEFYYALDLAVSKGFVGVTVDYTGVKGHIVRRPVGTFPAQVYDAKSAIRFLRANAKTYGLDPNRIGIIGHSSGGYLGLMLALTTPADGLEGQDNLQYPSTVQAVVNFAGPSDFLGQLSADAEAFVGGTLATQPDKCRRASATTYVHKGGAPILTIQGDQDLNIEDMIPFDRMMKDAGAMHTLVIKKGAGHMDFDTEDSIVWDFLDQYLKK
jgi:acetyl esterase/lipase